MATLTLASQANQATYFPALLIAHYANELGNGSDVEVTFEDAATLPSGKDDTIRFSHGGQTVKGSIDVIKSLLAAFPSLQDSRNKASVNIGR